MDVMLWGEQVRVIANHAARWNMAARGEREPGAYDAIDRLLKPGSTFLDIGSGVGEIALYAGRSAGTVLAVEAATDVCDTLARNLSLNDRETGTMRALNIRIARTTGSAGSMAFGEFERQWPLNDCTFVRVDIGGDEYSVVPAMLPYLRCVRPGLYLAIHPRRRLGIRGSNPALKVVVGLWSLLSVAYFLWMLRFYDAVYDASGSRLRMRDLPRIARSTVSLTFTDGASID
jgi:SAM-dependent methyltransferase